MKSGDRAGHLDLLPLLVHPADVLEQPAEHDRCWCFLEPGLERLDEIVSYQVYIN